MWKDVTKDKTTVLQISKLTAKLPKVLPTILEWHILQVGSLRNHANTLYLPLMLKTENKVLKPPPLRVKIKQ